MLDEQAMARLTDEELLETIERQLPDLLDRHPEMQTRIYHAFIRTFATRDEVAAVVSELRALRQDVDLRFGVVEGQLARLEQGQTGTSGC